MLCKKLCCDITIRLVTINFQSCIPYSVTICIIQVTNSIYQNAMMRAEIFRSRLDLMPCSEALCLYFTSYTSQHTFAHVYRSIHLWGLNRHTRCVWVLFSGRSVIPYTRAKCFPILLRIRYRPTCDMYLLLSHLKLLEDWYSSYLIGKSENSSSYDLWERRRRMYCVSLHSLEEQLEQQQQQ
jgi:hypothetical protein